MHRCLKIDEILLEIFLQVLLGEHQGQNYEPVRSRTVAGLARTCRAFRSPALVVLWREVNGLDQLFRVLPAAKLLWEEVVEPHGRKLISLKLEQPPTQEEWMTFFEYGARVQRLYLGDACLRRSGNIWIPVNVGLEALSAIPSARIVFPSLQRLYVEWAGRGTSLYHLFLSRSLQTVMINLRRKEYNPSLHGFLEKLGTHSQSLRSLTLNNLAFADYKARLPLEDLSPRLFDVSPSGNYSNLKDLRIGHTTNIDDWFPPGTLQFPRLTKLALLAPTGDFQNIEKLLSRFRCLSLHYIEVLISGDIPPEQSFQTLFRLIAQTCNIGDTLSEICIGQMFEDSNARPLDTEDMKLRFETLEPLTTLRLSEIRIDIPSPFILDDKDCHKLAKAWVELISLKLGSPSADSVQHAATISALRHFAVSCPRLECIGIPFRPEFSDEILWDEPLDSRSLVTTLYVRESGVRSHLISKVAAYFSGLFPKLREVQNCPISETEDLDKSWKKVNAQLSVFASVRRQEQLLAQRRCADAAGGDIGSLMEDSDAEVSSSRSASTTNTDSS
ncbi:hypothetical protein BKA70DRAFT_1287747 [Coprinopsis sp. MPI-PUGE-AT-0042]|nr:hypothetical protein BKA70DRAFT_1287747 [Coprinopsis sp. MPI-PUGE-AT-0042]